MEKRICLITGANGGIGKQIALRLLRKGHHVILLSREKITDQEIHHFSDQTSFYQLDLLSEKTAFEELFLFIKDHFHRMDILINNAAVFLDNYRNYPDKTLLTLPEEMLRNTMEVNFYAPFRLIQLFLPLMKENGFGRIVNVSSGMGRIDNFDLRCPFYRTSKLCLNGLTRLSSALVSPEEDILINAVCPGWVNSKMGGKDAPRSCEEGAKGIVWAAELEKNGPQGGFFRDQKPLDWCHMLDDPF